MCWTLIIAGTFEIMSQGRLTCHCGHVPGVLYFNWSNTFTSNCIYICVYIYICLYIYARWQCHRLYCGVLDLAIATYIVFLIECGVRLMGKRTITARHLWQLVVLQDMRLLRDTWLAHTFNFSQCIDFYFFIFSTVNVCTR